MFGWPVARKVGRFFDAAGACLGHVDLRARVGQVIVISDRNHRTGSCRSLAKKRAAFARAGGLGVALQACRGCRTRYARAPISPGGLMVMSVVDNGPAGAGGDTSGGTSS